MSKGGGFFRNIFLKKLKNTIKNHFYNKIGNIILKLKI